MSSKEEDELKSIAARSGADGYLTKPFSAGKLVHAIETFLTA
jgi:DNA-binding response OmpR family regulator